MRRRTPFDQVVNQSINQTLPRLINTQLTVMITLLALAIFGGVTIRHFVVTLLVGVFSGPIRRSSTRRQSWWCGRRRSGAPGPGVGRARRRDAWQDQQ